MSKEKMLAEWFWIDRWDGSPAAALPLEARGLYREMLTRAWRLGGWLPAEPQAIQRLVRVTPAEWRRNWPIVSPYWHLDDQGRLINDTQIEVMADARRRKDAASEHAKKASLGRRRAQPEIIPSTTRDVSRDQPEIMPPSPSPEQRTAVVGERARGLERPPNPLVDRDALVAEGHRLIREIAQADDLDPTEVLTQETRFKGRSTVRLDVISDDWLAHTVQRLRSRRRRQTGEAEPGADVPTLGPKLEGTAGALRRFVDRGKEQGI